MTQRLGIVVLLCVVGTAMVFATGCPHPYSGKPESLKKMKKKNPPEPEPGEVKPDEVAWDDKCRVNFQDDKPPKSRKIAPAKSMSSEADGMLVEAEDLDGERRILKVVDAIKKLKSALGQDQFSPLATYKLAVAYTLVNKKGCALMLLQRLNDLQRMPAVAREAELVIKRAQLDQTFDPFRKDADAAMGM